MTNLSNFKPIPGYEDLYLVNKDGQIYSKKRNKLLSPDKDKYGYLQVKLCKNGEIKNFKVHRLVALTFIQNPLNLPQVNHLDGDKLNNNISNLEWCTCSQNNKHAWKLGLKENVRAAARRLGKINIKFATEARIKHLDENLKELFDDIFKNNLKIKDIANKYNLSDKYIYKIKSKQKLQVAISEYFDKNPDIVYQSDNKVKKNSFNEKNKKCNF